MKEEKGTRPFDPTPTAAMGEWRTHPLAFTPRAEPAVSFERSVSEKTSNLCYTFKTANDEEPVDNALMASSSAAITSKDSVSSNLAILMMDSGALGRYFDDAIIHAFKHRLQDYVHLTTPRKILTAGGAMLDGTVEDVLQGLTTDDNGNQILVRADIVMAPGIGHNLLSMMSAARRASCLFSTAKTSGCRDSTSACHYGARTAASTTRSCWKVRDYTGILDFIVNITVNHEDASSASVDTKVQKLVDQIRDLTRRDVLTPAAPLPGAASLLIAKPLPEQKRNLRQGEYHRGVEGAHHPKQIFFRTDYSKKGNRYAQQYASSA